MTEGLRQTVVRFEPELHEKLQQMADEDGRRSLASLIRKICHEATQKPQGEQRSAA
jgi:hypothetical protein